MRDLDRYLDRILREADLEPVASERLRAELRDHLESLVQDHLLAGSAPAEAVQAACANFGEPSWLGRSLREALGGWRIWKSRFLRPLPVLLVLFFLGWGVNTYAFEVYSIVGASVAPRLEKGSRVVVEKWGEPIRPNDIVVYKDGSRSLVGIVDGIRGGDKLSVHRNDVGGLIVDRSRVVGRVVFKIQ